MLCYLILDITFYIKCWSCNYKSVIIGKYRCYKFAIKYHYVRVIVSGMSTQKIKIYDTTDH